MARAQAARSRRVSCAASGTRADDLRRLVVVEAELGQPIEDRFEGDLRLHARQVVAEAEVAAAAER